MLAKKSNMISIYRIIGRSQNLYIGTPLVDSSLTDCLCGVISTHLMFGGITGVA